MTDDVEYQLIPLKSIAYEDEFDDWGVRTGQRIVGLTWLGGAVGSGVPIVIRARSACLRANRGLPKALERAGYTNVRVERIENG